MSPGISPEFKLLSARVCRAEADIAVLMGDFELEKRKLKAAERLEQEAREAIAELENET